MGRDSEQQRGLAGVDSSLDTARSALESGLLEDARRSLEEATGPLDDLAPSPEVDRRRARALGLLAMLRYELDGTDAALATLDDAAAAATAAADEERIALTWSLRATVLGRSAMPVEALAALDRAVAHLGALPPRDSTTVLMNRGVLRGQVGDVDGGASDLRRAAGLADEHGFRVEQFMSLHNLGYLRYLRGDITDALAAMQQASELEVSIPRGINLLDRGRVLLEAGLLDEAHDILVESAAASADDGLAQIVAEATYELARVAQLRGSFDDALARVREAEARFEERAEHSWVLRCRLSAVLLRARRAHAVAPGRVPNPAVRTSSDLAEEAAELAVEATGRGGAVARTALTVAGETAALAGDARAARTALEAAGDGALPLLMARLDARRARTALALATGDVEDARRELAAAAEDIARSSTSATALDLRTARLAHGTVLASIDVALALTREDRPTATLETVDRWRAVSGRLPPLRAPAAPGDVEMLTRRRQLREALREARDDADEQWAELALVEREIAERRRITPGSTARAGPVAAGSEQPDDVRAVPVDRLLEELAADDRDLLVTFEHGGEVLAIDVTRGRTTLRAVGPAADVDEGARRLRRDLQVAAGLAGGALAASVRGSLVRAADSLGELLLGRRDPTDGRRLLVSTHGTLAGLPWGLLAPDRPVVLTSSPTAWVRTRARGTATSRRTGTTRARVVRGPRLAAASEEAALVATVWGADAPGGDQPAAALVDALAEAEVVHVVAHGHHHRQQPLFSALAMADGPCSMYDLEATGVRAAQVVMAACDAGRATMRPGDEPLGLTAGLLALGARSVVAPVTPVPDEILPPVMERLHAALAAGVPTDEALVVAREGAPLLTGAFVVSGTAQRLATPPDGT